jgi:hypothetical protein
MNKHTPATPLPWIDPRTIAASYSIWKGDTQVAACRWTDTNGDIHKPCVEDESEARQNAAYIAHACNAYQQLVDLLLKLQRSACLQQISGDKCICFACSARALLRELGEE